MVRKLRYFILILAAFFMIMSFQPLCAKGWEATKSEKVQGNHVFMDSELEVKTGRGVIYVASSKNINIKIFSILGSRIADDNLSAGSYQFQVPTHGVYIIKAGDLTFKVAV